MEIPLRKVAARVDLKAGNTFVRAQPKSRPGSPTKQSPTGLSPPSFRPKAKVNSAAQVRKLSSSSSLSTAQINNVSTPSNSRPNSPFKPSRIPNGSEASNSPKPRITARPTSRAGMSSSQTTSNSPEPRQRALTAASTKLKLPQSEERPRSGSVATLHHALSVSDLKPPFSPPASQPSPLSEHIMIDPERTHAPPVLPPIKIKSRVTGLAKSMPASAVDQVSRSLSPPYVTTRPIHRNRAPSITSSTFSLNDPPTPLPFYPITTASSAANPHRYAPRRAPSPARTHPSPPALSDSFVAKIPLVPKIDPASIPLPPHSPPISAISISSRSSVSRTSISLNGDQMPDNQISSILSHAKRGSMERISQPNVFYPPSEAKAMGGRHRSRSRDGSLHDLSRPFSSDAESEGSERQLRAEAKTNRKIADLEITNRSLLAINASLETTKNRQAKEIRDLRRKLRESRLILPPSTYTAVKSAEETDHDRDDEDDDEDDSDADENTVDEAFQRVRSLVDTLIQSGKEALETKPEDFRASLATKVLNADELRSWRDSGDRTTMTRRSSYVDKQDADDETIHSHLSPALVAVPDSDSESLVVESESEEVSDPSSSLPPITVTHSL